MKLIIKFWWILNEALQILVTLKIELVLSLLTPNMKLVLSLLIACNQVR